LKGIILQEILLNQARKERVPVTANMLNGEAHKGLVKGFDSFTIIMDAGGKQVMLYKHAIASIIPLTPISLTQQRNDI